ncbi:hypothetical protein Pst134EA_031740 [Puccinia striiformis f. sp. tritici]|uniref:uncharacterized protein n=1 Tax=Puccinia striiformis f. sp. tritici TaxID=168172 RepID=UPI00200871E6|nr:uncharacterized protein Pst134EA_031740 [Puccinia striiformis f. sp. tritici]KAH9442625.1 hypothetical protein Pst134EA_031740 [Puccinia striiformis f. sp. tritici]
MDLVLLKMNLKKLDITCRLRRLDHPPRPSHLGPLKKLTALYDNSAYTNIPASRSPVTSGILNNTSSSKLVPPLSIPANHITSGVQLIISSGSVIETTCSEIVATLHSTSWVLETISLELNILTQQAQRERATDLLLILFESASSPSQTKSILDQVGSPDQSPQGCKYYSCTWISPGRAIRQSSLAY